MQAQPTQPSLILNPPLLPKTINLQQKMTNWLRCVHTMQPSQKLSSHTSTKNPLNQLCQPWLKQSMDPTAPQTCQDHTNWSLQPSASKWRNSEPHWKRKQQLMRSHQPRDLHQQPSKSPPASPPENAAPDHQGATGAPGSSTTSTIVGLMVLTSAPCKNPKEGHRREATVTNQMGRDQTNCHLIPN